MMNDDARRARLKALWGAVMAIDPRLGAVTVPAVNGERLVVTRVDMKAEEPGRPAERVVLTPGKGPRSGALTFTRDESVEAQAQEVGGCLRIALAGLELDKRTHVGLRLVDAGAGAVTVSWSVGRMEPTEIEVDVPGLEVLTLPVPLRLVASCLIPSADEHPEELALTYELDLETQPVFHLASSRVKCEVRLLAVDLPNEEWVKATAEHIRYAAESDLREALGVFLGYASGALEVRPAPPPPLYPQRAPNCRCRVVPIETDRSPAERWPRAWASWTKWRGVAGALLLILLVGWLLFGGASAAR